MEDKSKCCQSSVVVRGKQSSGSTNWFECCDCKLPCDVVTDSKTAREVLLKHRERCNCDNAHGVCQMLESMIEDYASDKDKQITQLEAEVEQVSRYRYIASNELERIKELIGGASLHEETGVSLYDDVKDLMAENEKLRCACNSSSYAYLDLKKELTSLKSSLAEQRELNAILKIERNEALSKRDSLQLENGVMREALKFYEENWLMNGDGDDSVPGCSRTWYEPNDYLLNDEGRKAEQALLSTSTKSSLMEKVRALIRSAEYAQERLEYLKGGGYGADKAAVELESALTEVKKEMGI